MTYTHALYCLSRKLTYNIDCTNLLKDFYVCVHVPGAETNPPDDGHSPTQDGIAKDCDKYHKVASGDQCDKIEDKYRITHEQFSKWNPAINSRKFYTRARTASAGIQFTNKTSSQSAPTFSSTTMSASTSLALALCLLMMATLPTTTTLPRTATSTTRLSLATIATRLRTTTTSPTMTSGSGTLPLTTVSSLLQGLNN